MIISTRISAVAKARPIYLSLLSVVLLSACVAPQGNKNRAPDTQGTTVPVKLFFAANGCPTAADPESFDRLANSGDKVQWLAYRGTGSSAEFDSSIEFAVYFDPFVDGKTLFSRKGKTTSSKINPNAAAKTAQATDVYYKYSVVGKGCEDKPLDPRMIIAR